MVIRVALLVVGLFALGATVPGSAVEIADIPKPQRWVTDLTASIPSSAVAEIQVTADRIERENGGQLAVVVLGTLGGKEPRPFATELFNAWGIGRAEQDDGLLIFVALDDHRVELLLGDGIDDLVRQRASDEIVQQVMVPQFKAGNPGEALVQGVKECARRIYRLADPAAAAPPAPAVFQPRRLASTRVQQAGGWTAGSGSWLLAFGGIGAVLAWLRYRERHQPRKCPSCRQTMVRLDESSEDAHLEPGERVEENLRTVDYDVWACPACDKILKLRFEAFFTRRLRCPKCDFVTVSKSSTTIEQATTSHGGTVRVDETCANCGFAASSTHSIPMLADSTYSSSDSGGSSSSSGGFGGGSTSGGGSSGHW